MKTIDLNADVGEGAPWDAELIPLVTSANLACGGHAGDERTMEAAARLAIESGVAIGAHPGHEDREHFGRQELPITPDECRALLERQVNRLHSVVRGLGGELKYVKPHGGLYHQAAHDPAIAAAVVEFVEGFHVPLALMGRSGSAVANAADGRIEFANEAFPDRRHLADGSLAPRSEPGALLDSGVAIAEQAGRLAEAADSLCLHGDERGVVERAHVVCETLRAAGYSLRAFTA